MNQDTELRAQLAHMLHSSGVYGLRDQGLEDDFVAGAIDPSLVDLGIDSLAEMELCIAVENQLGVTIIPAELEDLKTMSNLLARIAGASKDAI